MKPRVVPSIAHLSPGDYQVLHVEPDSFRKDVIWSICGVKEADGDLGTITFDGNYNAPMGPARGEVVVTALVKGNETRRLWATMVVDTGRPQYSCVGTWERKGDNGITEAHGICVAHDGNLLVADPVLSRVMRFTSGGNYIGDVGLGKGTDPGKFDGPRDLDVGPNGEIYVADGNNARIQVYDSSGRFLRTWGERGSGPSDLLRPHSLAVGPDGLVYVVDVDNSKVAVYDIMGRFMDSWGTRGNLPGEFLAPHGIAVDPNGDVFVVEYNGRCQKFSPSGEFFFCFANPGSVDGMSHGNYRYHAMTSDRWGNVYLVARNTLDNYSTSVDKYNNNGDFVTRFSCSPSGNPKLKSQAAAVASNGRVFVSGVMGRGESRHGGVSIYDPQ